MFDKMKAISEVVEKKFRQTTEDNKKTFSALPSGGQVHNLTLSRRHDVTFCVNRPACLFRVTVLLTRSVVMAGNLNHPGLSLVTM